MNFFKQAIQNLLRLVPVILGLSMTASAAVPQLISYQGLLKNNLGNPVPNASYSIVFTIYDAATGGANLWSETQSVTTSGGSFIVLLGSGPTPLDYSLFNDSTRYLGITVGADPEMTPRYRLETVPYSYRTSTVDGASGGTIYGDVGIGASPLRGSKLSSFPPGSSKLYVYNSGYDPNGLIGVSGEANNSSSGAGYGVYGLGSTYGVSGSGNFIGVNGTSTGGYYGVYGSGGAIGVYGVNGYYGVAGEGSTVGVYGMGNLGGGTFGGTGGGSYGVSASGDSYGVDASGGSYGGRFTGTGVLSYGVSAVGQGYGVSGSSLSGTGVEAVGGSNGVYAYSPTSTGVYASSGSGTGVYANGGGYGVWAVGSINGVVGLANANGGSGVYGSNSGNPSTYAGYFSGTLYTHGDFIASGSKSAAVKTDNGEYRLLYAQESPENWFEDFGTAQLVNGQATVKIDPLYAQTVNTAVTYHVFLTPEGDCQGLYVSSKTPASFEIRELQNGKSSLSVSYRIVAKRKGYENIRLAKLEGPTPEEAQTQDIMLRAEVAKENALHQGEQARMEQENKKMEAERKLQEEQRAKMEAERKLQEEQRVKMDPKH